MISVDAMETLSLDRGNIQWGTYKNGTVLGVSSEGGWHHIDGAGNPITIDGTIDKTRGSHSGFDDLPIYRDIQTVVIDSLRAGQVLVRIPRFYYRREGTGFAEYPYRLWISDYPLLGFQVHPAFLVNGKMRDCFYVGAYACGGDNYDSMAGFPPKVSINFPTAYSGIAENHGPGWGMWNIYQLSAIQMLFLVEFANPDAQLLIGSGNTGSSNVANGASSAIYRGIYEFWANVHQMVYGLRGYESTAEAEILRPDGSGEFVRTGYIAQAGSAAGINAVEVAAGDGFDLKAVHLPNNQMAGVADFTDGYWGVANGFVAYHGGNRTNGAGCGVFALALHNAASLSHASIGVRLAKV